jgi:protein CrcB
MTNVVDRSFFVVMALRVKIFGGIDWNFYGKILVHLGWSNSWSKRTVLVRGLGSPKVEHQLSNWNHADYLTGSLLLGFFMTLATERFMLDPRWRVLIVVGFLGAYTTFSTYTYESFNLIFKGQWLAGLLNLIGSSILGIISVGIGVYLGKSL